jgi:hypothetical protein
MLNFCTSALRGFVRTAIVNMNMSPEVCTVEVAHHWGVVIVGWELVPFELKHSFFRSLN